MLCKICGEKEASIKSDQGNLIMCEQCGNEWHSDNKKIDAFVEFGHSRHCAYRLVWGDGECECNCCR